MTDTPARFPDEDAWTAELARRLPRRPDVVAGIGDDAAVVRAPSGTSDLVYTTDAVVEGLHFLPGAEPRRIGRKMVGRLLSDLAAMGAAPDHVLLNLVVPPGTKAGYLLELYDGAAALASAFDAVIVGGDTIRGEKLELHGFASGHVPTGEAVMRSGAKPGDRLYVTGELGGSIAGHHLDFTPRVREGSWLRENGWATAMMDVSDGLARDLPRLCRAGRVGACIRAVDLPLRTDAASWTSAWSDGEDYELLFTVRADGFESAWRSAWPIACTCIGVVTPSTEGIRLVLPDGSIEMPEAGGFDHFGA